MDEHRFRPDLYYRLNVFPIEVAPLRRRKDDIPVLATLFLERACARLNLPRSLLTPDNIDQLEQYDWPGNVRELQNIIERAVITSRGGALHFALSPATRSKPRARRPGETEEIVTAQEMRQREHDNMIAALQRTGGKIYGQNGAAAMLGIKPTTLAARLKTIGFKNSNRS